MLSGVQYGTPDMIRWIRVPSGTMNLPVGSGVLDLVCRIMCVGSDVLSDVSSGVPSDVLSGTQDLCAGSGTLD